MLYIYFICQIANKTAELQIDEVPDTQMRKVNIAKNPTTKLPFIMIHRTHV